MHIKVKVDRYHSWELRHQDDVQPGEIAMPAHEGPMMRRVKQTHEEPNVTDVHMPDSDIERMVADHDEAVQNGGKVNDDGSVNPIVPPMARNQLIGRHLQNVMGMHSDQPSGVEIADSSLEEDDRANLERYLQVVLTGGVA